MLVAGVDIGNSTTEVVLAEGDGAGMRPVLERRCRTAGLKGSPESLRAAARLLERAEEAAGARCVRLGIAPLFPVLTLAGEVPRPRRPEPPVRDLCRGGATPSGRGFAAGRHVSFAALSAAPAGEPLVVSVPADVDFEDAALGLARAHAAGSRVVAVVVANDDAVLIANRVPFSVPVVDEAAVDDLRPGEIVAVEVAPAGETLTVLSDPVALAAALGLPAESAAEVLSLTERLADARCAALVARPSAGGGAGGEGAAWVEFEEAGGLARLPLSASPAQLSRAIRPGSVRRVVLPGPASDAWAGARVTDFFAVDLPAVGRVVAPRAGSVDLTLVPFSLLTAPDEAPGRSCAGLEELTGRPVREVLSEPAAAALGSLSTPGCPADAAVCDLGGGTIDLVWGARHMTAAGAGDLLTLTAAHALGIPLRLAEHVKRTAAFRAEAPHVVRYEDGDKAFLDEALRPEVLGRLCIGRGAGVRAFSDKLAPEEWRTIRLAIKRSVVGVNVRRCLDALPEAPRALLLCGGAALDAEAVRIVTEAVSDLHVTVGRAHVAGRFGARDAAAYGLACAAADEAAWMSPAGRRTM